MTRLRVIEIRPATKTDEAKILALIGRQRSADARQAQKYYSAYFKKRQRPSDGVIVAASNGGIVGISGYFYDDYSDNGIYWLGWTYVRQSHQQRGIGARLLNEVLNELRRRKARKVFVDTSSKEFYRRAYKFYRKAGFTKQGVLKDYYSDGEDQIILGKDL